MAKTELGFIRTGDEQTLIDKAINESLHLSLNNGKYTLEKVIEYIKSLGKLHQFPSLVKLNKQMPGIILLNCGGMPVLKLPYQEDKRQKLSKTTKKKSEQALF